MSGGAKYLFSSHYPINNTFYFQVRLKDHFRENNQLKNQIIESANDINLPT